MGCNQSNEDRENKKIAQEQAKAKLHNKQAIKILLLGTGDSGKTSEFFHRDPLFKNISSLTFF